MSRLRPCFARTIDLALEATVAPSFTRIGHTVRSRLESWPDLPSLPGTGLRVLVTGANSGLGYATTRAVLAAGGEVIGTVRTPQRGNDALASLVEELGFAAAARARFELLDLAELDSVRGLAARLTEDEPAIDVVVHNAGAMFSDRQLTDDGLERTYQIHVVAPFLLTTLLLPHLRRSAVGRVITVTSGGMYTQELDVTRIESNGDYQGATAYARAKRAQVELTTAWADRISDVEVHAVHPGWALTPGIEASLPTFRRMAGPLLRTADQGADTIAWLTLRPEAGGNGQLWHDRRPRSVHRVPWTRTDDAEVARLWDRVVRDAGIDPLAATEAALRSEAEPNPGPARSAPR